MDQMPDMYPPTLEFRILAALMAVAVASVLWTTFREFQRNLATDPRESEV